VLHAKSFVETLGAERRRTSTLQCPCYSSIIRTLRPTDTLRGTNRPDVLCRKFFSNTLINTHLPVAQLGLRVLPNSNQYQMSSSASPASSILPTSSLTIEASFWVDLENTSNRDVCRNLVKVFGLHLTNLYESKSNKNKSQACQFDDSTDRLLESRTVILALKNLISSHKDNPHEISETVRMWEYYLGNIAKTNLTDQLSLWLLITNCYAGNVGRVLALLQLRSNRNYKAVTQEYLHAIDAIHISMSKNGRRNLYVGDAHQPPTDNPTRWLDAILLNMKGRNFTLTTTLVNEMLHCYSCRSGPTGKAMHHFYRVVRQPVYSDDLLTCTMKSTMPMGWVRIRENDLDDICEEKENRISDKKKTRHTNSAQTNGKYSPLPVKVQLSYYSKPPPFFKVPSQVKGKLLFRNERMLRRKAGTNNRNSTTIPRQQKFGQYRIEREMDPHFSVPLSAAFAFADSVQHGACGHQPIKFNIDSYNALIKACVNRGSLWRAIHLIDNVMQSSSEELIRPNIVSYNLLLAGLARVGDVVTAQEYMYKILNAGLAPNKYTVRAIIDGLLNLGDVGGAVTVAQDFFNQHSVLPPISQLTKILEFCLALDLLYEAKRYCYFIQQLLHWKPNQYHTPEFINFMETVKENEQLQKPALKKMFSYFGANLLDSDFL
jgi:Pentatricopeptide repeat domain